MKYLLTTILLISSVLAYGQKWEVGFMTGSRLCFTSPIVNHDKLYNSLIPNELSGNNGIDLMLHKNQHWSYQLSIEYFRITNTGSNYFGKYYLLNYLPDYLGYYGTLENKNFDIGFTTFYNFIGRKHNRFFSYIKSSIGISVSYNLDIQKYRAGQIDTDYFNPVSTNHISIGNTGELLIGIDYRASYAITAHLYITGLVSFKASTDAFNRPGPDLNITSYFYPMDFTNFGYQLPSAFITWQIGLGYKL